MWHEIPETEKEKKYEEIIHKLNNFENTVRDKNEKVEKLENTVKDTNLKIFKQEKEIEMLKKKLRVLKEQVRGTTRCVNSDRGEQNCKIGLNFLFSFISSRHNQTRDNWYHLSPYGTIRYHLVPFSTIRYHSASFGIIWYH